MTAIAIRRHARRANAARLGSAFAITFALAVTACTPNATAPRSTSADQTMRAPADDAWASFWRAHHVSPAPPRDVFDPVPPEVKVLNLTNGQIADDIARRWVLANIRRSNADTWAMRHLRMDIVDAGVLGPPGLNGTGKGILAERAKGTVELVISDRAFPVVTAVIAVPPDLKQEDASAGLTDFVIVKVFRATGRPNGERVRSDGSREPLHSRRLVGELVWQLDTGEFRDDPVIGPIWYQAKGWGCIPGKVKAVPRLCAMVQPDQ